MHRVMIKGGRRLNGEVRVQGSKNAALPILAAALLTEGKTVITNCPNISDVADMLQILRQLGCRAAINDNIVTIDSSDAIYCDIDREDASGSRSSILFMGALLGRFGHAILPYPGGCSIGVRPVDLHISSLRKMNVNIEEFTAGYDNRYIICRTSGIKGTQINLRFPSVGATENIILAAVLADGVTTIYNAAMEPEIGALCDFLNKAGACIVRELSTIYICGAERLHSVKFRIPGDRIVAGTYMCMTAACGGHVRLNDVDGNELTEPIKLLESMGCRILYSCNHIMIERNEELYSQLFIETQTYPGFPTDLQSQFMGVMTAIRGINALSENIFEERFKVVDELKKLGADIDTYGSIAVVRGGKRLKGTEICAYDLRGGAALIIAGLTAEGVTFISGREYVERGYEDIVRDVRLLGGEIWREEEVQKS